jgi:hypothetical protein
LVQKSGAKWRRNFSSLSRHAADKAFCFVIVDERDTYSPVTKAVRAAQRALHFVEIGLLEFRPLR